MGLLYQIFGGFENHVITQWTEQFYRSSNKYTKIQILISFFFACFHFCNERLFFSFCTPFSLSLSTDTLTRSNRAAVACTRFAGLLFSRDPDAIFGTRCIFINRHAAQLNFMYQSLFALHWGRSRTELESNDPFDEKTFSFFHHRSTYLDARIFHSYYHHL